MAACGTTITVIVILRSCDVQYPAKLPSYIVHYTQQALCKICEVHVSKTRMCERHQHLLFGPTFGELLLWANFRAGPGTSTRSPDRERA